MSESTGGKLQISLSMFFERMVSRSRLMGNGHFPLTETASCGCNLGCNLEKSMLAGECAGTCTYLFCFGHFPFPSGWVNDRRRSGGECREEFDFD